MEKYLVFDMDGTIVDLYGFAGWAKFLDSKSTLPYQEAEPLVFMAEFGGLLQRFHDAGVKIAFLTWASKQCDKDFFAEIEKIKKEYLIKYELSYDNFWLLPYGESKADFFKKNQKNAYGILFDDEQRNIQGWQEHGLTAVDVTKNNLIDVLQKIAEKL